MPKTGAIVIDKWVDPNPYFQYYNGLERRIINGVLEIDAIAAYPAVTTRETYDLVGSVFGVEILQRPNVSNGSTEAYVELTGSAANSLCIGITGPSMFIRSRVNSVNNDVYIDYSATQHKFFRMREASGRVYWESSVDGLTWTSLRPDIATPFPVTAVSPTLYAGNWNSAPDPGFVRYGRVNSFSAAKPTNEMLYNGTAWKSTGRYKKVL